MTDRKWLRGIAWAGWGVGQFGAAAFAAWVGLSAGWIALSVPRGSGGWLPVMIVVFAVYLGLPGGLLYLGGQFVRRRLELDPSAATVRLIRIACGLAAASGAVFAYLGGWPR